MSLEPGPKGAELKMNPDWVPPDDLVFQRLLEEATLGRVPVYYAAVPLAALRRFAPTFRPENTIDGPEVVAQITQRWRAGDFVKMWVYPKGGHFIVSDDYSILAAAERGKPDFLPCWVLGGVPDGSAQNVQGPVGMAYVRELLGIK